MSTATIDAGRQVLRLESEAIARAAAALDGRFAEAVQVLQACHGRVIVSGVGKSGLVARKVAATLTSTGTPATFLHAVDSQHGDLGIVGPHDAAILISKSGETTELFGLLEALQRLGVPVIAITGAPDSTLGRAATVTLDGSVTSEACPHGLAPTTSTAVALALGDALAVVVLSAKGFGPEDFAALHPGGRLGRRLLLRVRDVMQPPLGTLRRASTMRDAVVALAEHRGLAIVTEQDRVIGVLTAGDLSRIAERQAAFLDLPVDGLMTPDPVVAGPGDLAAAVVGRMEQRGIMAMPVIDTDGRLTGVVHLHDLMRAGAV